MSQCVDCSKAAMRDRENPKRDEVLRALARGGGICCNVSPCRATFHYATVERQCADFAPVAEDIALKRRAFYLQREQD